MDLRRKVQHPVGGSPPQPEFARLKPVLVADPLVSGKHGWLALLESMRETLAHNADAVHGVDQRLSARLKDAGPPVNQHRTPSAKRVMITGTPLAGTEPEPN